MESAALTALPGPETLAAASVHSKAPDGDPAETFEGTLAATLGACFPMPVALPPPPGGGGLPGGGEALPRSRSLPVAAPAATFDAAPPAGPSGANLAAAAASGQSEPPGGPSESAQSPGQLTASEALATASDDVASGDSPAARRGARPTDATLPSPLRPAGAPSPGAGLVTPLPAGPHPEAAPAHALAAAAVPSASRPEAGGIGSPNAAGLRSRRIDAPVGCVVTPLPPNAAGAPEATVDGEAAAKASPEAMTDRADGIVSSAVDAKMDVSAVADRGPAAGLERPVTAAGGGDRPRDGEPLQASLQHELVGTPRWQQELGQRLVGFAEQGIREVRLHLHPEHLGPLEVRVTLQDAQVGLWLGTGSAETREALQNSLPRLREMFAQSGFTMADASIAHQQSHRHPQDPPAPAPVAFPREEPAQVGIAMRLDAFDAARGTRLLDEYA